MAAAAAALAGCGGDQSTLAPRSDAARTIGGLWWTMLVASAVVFAVVLALLLVAVLRRRAGDVPPERLDGGPSWPVLVGGAAVPLVVLVALFVLTVAALPDTAPAVDGDGALTVRVTGRQWFWDVDYPGSGVRTANEVHVPVGVPVNVEVESGDVVHSFWVPRLNRKIDMVPGRTNRVTIRADRAGVYRGQCAEFCGLQHQGMAFVVVAEPQDAFRRWLADQAKPPPSELPPHLQQGQQVFLGSACVYCHTIRGTNASGRIGPDLTHFGSRRTIGAGLVPNSRGYLGGWILDPQHLKPGNRMPGTDLSGDELQAVIDYLESLR